MKLAVVLEMQTIEYCVEASSLEECAEQVIVNIMDHGFGDFRGSNTVELWTVRQIGEKVEVNQKVGAFELQPTWLMRLMK